MLTASVTALLEAGPFMAAINDAGRFQTMRVVSDPCTMASSKSLRFREIVLFGSMRIPTRHYELTKSETMRYFRTCLADRRGEEFRAIEARSRGDDLLNSNDHQHCRPYQARLPCSGRLGKVGLVP